MAFLKALQVQEKPPGFEEYVQAKLVYSQQCSFDAKLRRSLKQREDAAAIVALHKQSREFSLQTKVYLAARERYQAAVVRMELERKGFSLEQLGISTIAEMMSIKIPLTTRELVEEHKRQRVAASMTDKDKDAVLEGVRIYQEQRALRAQSTRDSFLSDREVADPAFGDFEPL